MSVGYGSTGYSTVGYGDSDPDTLSALEALLQPGALAPLTDSVPAEAFPGSDGDGTVAYRIGIQHVWLDFPEVPHNDSVLSMSLDDSFQKFTAFGLSFGGSKSFHVGNMVEIIPGIDLDLRLFWGDYSYLYDDNPVKLRTRFGAMFTMDLRSTIMCRVNWKFLYAEVGPQFGINILQTKLIKYEEVFGIPEEDASLFIFAVVPGVGLHYKDTDVGFRLIPDITNMWKESKASMVSLQLVVTFWH